jgi:hypothetical protein
MLSLQALYALRHGLWQTVGSPLLRLKTARRLLLMRDKDVLVYRLRSLAKQGLIENRVGNCSLPLSVST